MTMNTDTPRTPARRAVSGAAYQKAVDRISTLERELAEKERQFNYAVERADIFEQQVAQLRTALQDAYDRGYFAPHPDDSEAEIDAKLNAIALAKAD